MSGRAGVHFLLAQRGSVPYDFLFLTLSVLLNTAVPLQSDLVFHRSLDAFSKSVEETAVWVFLSQTVFVWCVRLFFFGWPEQDDYNDDDGKLMLTHSS